MHQRTFYILLAVISLNASVRAEEKAVIAFHSPVNGSLEECNCQGGRKGGIARLKAYSDSLKQACPTAIFVSPGNWLTDYKNAAIDSLACSILKDLGFDAVALGPLDLTNGLGFILDQAPPGRVDWVNCNIYQGAITVFKPHIQVQRPWGSALITSAVSAERIREYVPDSLITDLEVKEPVDALIKTAEGYSFKNSPVVIVSYLTKPEEDSLLAKWDRQRPLLLLRPGQSSGIDSLAGRPGCPVIELGMSGRCGGTARYRENLGFIDAALEVLDTTRREDGTLKMKADLFYRTRGLYKRMVLEHENGAADAVKINNPPARTKQLTLYYSPECPDCLTLIERQLKPLVRRGCFSLKAVDITVPGNYLMLVEAQKKTGLMTKNIPVAGFEGRLYDGKEEITENLLSQFKR